MKILLILCVLVVAGLATGKKIPGEPKLETKPPTSALKPSFQSTKDPKLLKLDEWLQAVLAARQASQSPDQASQSPDQAEDMRRPWGRRCLPRQNCRRRGRPGEKEAQEVAKPPLASDTEMPPDQAEDMRRPLGRECLPHQNCRKEGQPGEKEAQEVAKPPRGKRASDTEMPPRKGKRASATEMPSRHSGTEKAIEHAREKRDGWVKVASTVGQSSPRQEKEASDGTFFSWVASLLPGN